MTGVAETAKAALAARIRQARRELGTDQKELASQLGVHANTVGSWERGEKTPDVFNLASLCKVLGVSVQWLLSGEEAAGTAESTPAPALPTDHRLIGRLTEKIVILYKEMGFGIALHQAAERAAREHDRIVATVADPDDRLIQIGEVIAELRQELRAKAADPSSSKQRA